MTQFKINNIHLVLCEDTLENVARGIYFRPDNSIHETLHAFLFYENAVFVFRTLAGAASESMRRKKRKSVDYRLRFWYNNRMKELPR